MYDTKQDPFLQSAQSREGYASQSFDLVGWLTKRVNIKTDSTDFVRVYEKDGFCIRNLTQNEIKTLEGDRCKCRCSDWDQIRLMFAKNHKSLREKSVDSTRLYDMSSFLSKQISDCVFSGFVVLGLVLDNHSDAEGTRSRELATNSRMLRPGAHRNVCIRDSILEPGCRVYGNGIIERTHIYPNCSVINCGTITRYPAPSKMVTMLQVCVGPESGGERLIPIFPESTIVDACQSLSVFHASEAKLVLDKAKKNIYQKSQALVQECPLNILLPNSSICDNPNTITNVFLASEASIHSSCTVSNVTLLPHATISSNCSVKNVFVQWNGSVSNSAIVSNSIVMEASTVSNSAIVHSSILGPDVHLEGGETNHSLIGPNTNSHHQSLLIGVIWPFGRGNVGYGANVGSNHTGRIPDQECWAGEGLFWGLSCSIKFPVNTIFAPYSIIAAGALLQPQKVEMPFSLILENGTIHPGWVLGHSAYTIARAEQKIKQRRKAIRHAFYTGWKITRPGIIQMCVIARNRLISKDLTGIGKCELSESARKDGISFYSQYIQRYALNGLLNQLLKMSDSIQDNYDSLLPPSGKVLNMFQLQNFIDLPWEELSVFQPEAEWRYQYSLILHEFPEMPIAQLMKYLKKLEDDYANQVTYSKSKDDYRGRKIIPQYEDVHVLVDEDPVVKLVQSERKATVSKVNKVLEGGGQYNFFFQCHL